ncbi:hypothetical protein LCGC14_1610410 [marine sediment metagenome]|uniref:Uncharacterized protein n=1 Tax=marine sediment metagenome TaxID=412755 RepID=A0A0F9I8H6_9ZZZZ
MKKDSAKTITKPPDLVPHRTPKRPHLTQRGKFRSDKYKTWCKPGFLALKFTDETAQPWIWGYALLRGRIDREFQEDVHYALVKLGYQPGLVYSLVLRVLKYMQFHQKA